jgi:hypothetical protein
MSPLKKQLFLPPLPPPPPATSNTANPWEEANNYPIPISLQQTCDLILPIVVDFHRFGAIRIRLSILMPNTDPDPDPTQRFSHFVKLERKKIFTAIHSNGYPVFIVYTVFLSRQRQKVQYIGQHIIQNFLGQVKLLIFAFG